MTRCTLVPIVGNSVRHDGGALEAFPSQVVGGGEARSSNGVLTTNQFLVVNENELLISAAA
jgi:hypothetical protein